MPHEFLNQKFLYLCAWERGRLHCCMYAMLLHAPHTAMAAQARRFLASQDWNRAKSEIYNIYNRDSVAQQRRCIVSHQVTPLADPIHPSSLAHDSACRGIFLGCCSILCSTDDGLQMIQHHRGVSTPPVCYGCSTSDQQLELAASCICRCQ